MLDQLPAFLWYVMGPALLIELVWLVGFVLVVAIRRGLYNALRRFE
jgi:hypothetical protein